MYDKHGTAVCMEVQYTNRKKPSAEISCLEYRLLLSDIAAINIILELSDNA